MLNLKHCLFISDFKFCYKRQKKTKLTQLYLFLKVNRIPKHIKNTKLPYTFNPFSQTIKTSSLNYGKIKGRFSSSLYFALGAIRTRDLSLKRGVLYLLSYKRKLKFAIHFVCGFMLTRKKFNVNSFFLFLLKSEKFLFS